MKPLREGLRTTWPFAVLAGAYIGLLVVGGDWRPSHGLLAGLALLTGLALGASTVREACEGEIQAARERATQAELERWESLKQGLKKERV